MDLKLNILSYPPLTWVEKEYQGTAEQSNCDHPGYISIYLGILPYTYKYLVKLLKRLTITLFSGG